MSPYARSGFAVRLLYLVISLGIAGLRRVLLKPPPHLVLCYHGVTPAQRPRFRRQIACLARRGHPVSVTFDDAFANLLENALPAIAEFGILPRVFIVSENLGAPPRWPMPPGHPDACEPIMTRAQLVAAVAAGRFKPASHTATHPRLTDLPDAQLRRELESPRQALESWLGVTIDELAFPHGDYDERVVAAARRAGYVRMFTLDERPVSSDGDLVGRFLMTPDAWPIEFHLTCRGAYAWLYHLRRFVRGFRRSQRLVPVKQEAAA